MLVGLLVVAIAAVGSGILLPAMMCRPPDPVLDHLGAVGSFALTDERNQPFNDDALRGHITLVNFIFTRCDTICPVTTMKMAGLQEKTFDIAAKVKLASFSVDPEYDTPERLAEFAQRHRADPARWRFITGKAEAMRQLVEGPFMNSMTNEGIRATGAPQISHSGYFALVDSKAQIRGLYDSNNIQRLDEMLRDARFLIRTGG